MRIPFTTPDQREVALRVRFNDAAAHSWAESLWVTVRAPEPRHLSHGVTDVGGNNNQRPDPGEAISYSPRLRNLGTGTGIGVTAILRNYDGLATITDSTSTFGTIAPQAEVQGDPFASRSPTRWPRPSWVPDEPRPAQCRSSTCAGRVGGAVQGAGNGTNITPVG